ncbi:MAG: 4Fe-4S binding protein [Lachnospiraceae bacterium]|nr:4Fe-4S binding protein [Lachnospiraceae bacterium]MBQ9592358.1 4Fe-4S binding protein [Lachnospiraceae bacterium]MBR0154278.1 4Fe-4S binding protein [Lachnospiraceae bacterium]
MAKEYRHSVSLDRDRCKGCTHCLRRCPVEAIRIHDGKARINSNRCIDCGVCIDVCPHKAKKATSDKLADIKRFKYTVALPAPSLYGQFDNLDDIDYVLQGLLDLGFDDVYEVSRAAEVVSGLTRIYLSRDDIEKPVISSACPVIVRLISLRYPYLCENILPIQPPVDIAAHRARERALEKHPELTSEDIGIVFISPCPAKVSYIKNGSDGKKSDIDLVLSMSDIYFDLLDVMKMELSSEPISHTGMIGVSWASTGGEASALFNDKYLAADGIENVIRVLEQIDNGNFPYLEFIELNACNGGCVGGMMTVENPYIAKARLQTLKRYLPVSENWDFRDDSNAEIPEKYLSGPVEYAPVSALSSNMSEAMAKMSRIQEIHKMLPDIDCGFCGSPTCYCFAEDVVKGNADISECIFMLREKMQKAAKEEQHEDQ